MFPPNRTVRYFSANTQGRDFVVGDLHGCLSMLERLLGHVRFDPQRDRLFSVGDLVNRGPESGGCLRLLDEPWFHAVLGNHDAMLLAWASHNKSRRGREYAEEFRRQAGLIWAKPWAQDRKLRKHYVDRLETLPLVCVVGIGTPGRFNVVHAELRVGPEGFTDLLLENPAAPLWQQRANVVGGSWGTWRDQVLWGRGLRKVTVQRPDTPVQDPELSRTYVGHTIVSPHLLGHSDRALLQVQSHVYVDTGAYNAHRHAEQGLTIFCHPENRGWFLGGNGRIFEVQVI